jgi:hypothetical protein
LIAESDELIAIFVASVATAQKNRTPAYRPQPTAAETAK